MESKRKKILTFIYEKPWVSRNKGGASPEGVDNLSDSSVTLNEAGTSTDDESDTTGTEYAGARSSVDPKVSSGTKAADGAKGEGSESCHGNSVAPNAMVLRSFLETRQFFAPGLVLVCFHRPWEGNIRVWC